MTKSNITVNMYCNVCNKYRKFKKTKISCFFKKALFCLSFVYSKCSHEYEKIFERQESIEILKFLL